MEKMIKWMLAAILVCSVSVFTSCTGYTADNPVPAQKKQIAIIAKNGTVEYWQQIRSTFETECADKGVEALCYFTTSDFAFDEQRQAVSKLSAEAGNGLKGIVYAPCVGENGETADAEVAALVQKLGIPVVVIDNAVAADSPLASCPFFGTDSKASGEALADKVTAENVAAFAIGNGPGKERAEAFKAKKPGTAVCYTTKDKVAADVKAALDGYNDFVFFNGELADAVLSLLKDTHKNVYSFDVYQSFIDEMMVANSYFKGIMGQDTETMVLKAVEAVLNRAAKGEMIAPIYYTINDFVTPIPDLSEKIIGKWMVSELEGQPCPTNWKTVLTFVSPTQAYGSLSDFFSQSWNVKVLADVKIDGNNVGVITHDEANMNVLDCFILDISDKKMLMSSDWNVYVDGNSVQHEVYGKECYERITKDYQQDILGTWEGMVTSAEDEHADGQLHRWEYKADGTYVYYDKDGAEWVTHDDVLAEYFVDGILLCTRWKNTADSEELREWWEIESIEGGVMKWKALREREDGSTYTATFQMTRVK